MKRYGTVMLMWVAATCGAAPMMALAADQMGQSAERKTAPAASAPSAPAAATPAHTPSAPMTPLPPVEGMITSLDLNATTPNFKLRAADQKEWTFTLHPETVSIWRSGQRMTPAQLQTNQRAKVRYTGTTDGKFVATSIQLMEPLAASTAHSPQPGASY